MRSARENNPADFERNELGGLLQDCGVVKYSKVGQDRAEKWHKRKLCVPMSVIEIVGHGREIGIEGDCGDRTSEPVFAARVCPRSGV